MPRHTLRPMNILITGGAGYIGSHAVQRMLRDGHRVVCIDNLSRGHAEAMRRLGWRDGGGPLTFVKSDIADRAVVERALVEHEVEAVMHFAALAYVGESVEQPLRYYRNNTAAALSLLESVEAASRAGAPLTRFIFSSTCATYGEPPPKHIPIAETCPQSPINPYGRSKLHVEHILADVAQMMRMQGREFAYANLRYFNVAGSDTTGVLGEDHKPETHLIPLVLQAAAGRRDAITIFGRDYPTPDGTCIRDYVHVEDLIDAHVVVLNSLGKRDADGRATGGSRASGTSAPLDQPSAAPGQAYNLGIGRGYSVLEVIAAARDVTGRPIPTRDGPRRPGDPPTLYANPAKIRSALNWQARHTDLRKIIESAWKWMQQNPQGYYKL